MKQTEIIQRFVGAFGLDDGMTRGKFTISEAKTLVKYDNCEPTSGMFSYRRVVGMLLYIYGNTH